MAFTVANPHPGFGKDPNIINEFGHTRFPRWVENIKNEIAKTKAGKPIFERVLVQDAKEEAEVTGNKPVIKAKGDWAKGE